VDESNLLVRRFLDAQGNGPARRAAQSRLLTGFERSLSPRSLVDGTAHDLQAFLDGSIAEGLHPNTVRKWLVIARSFYAWLYRQGHIGAETLLAIREIRPPAGSSTRVQPRPYSGTQLTTLRTTLDARWPKLAPDEARRLTARWREGRSPYRRIRRHAIRLQLDAVIALALQLGLRRSEIFALDIDAAHYDNAYVVVAGKDGTWDDRCRTVPFTEDARYALYEWLEFRALLGIRHDRPWVALQGGGVGAPMKRAAFDKLLRTFVGDGWTLKRLRDTCAVTWLRRGLPPEHLRQLTGHRSLEDMLPYMRLVGGTLEQRMYKLDSRLFDETRDSQRRNTGVGGTPAVLIEPVIASVSAG
jgi:site-specific recombinase XerD